MTLELELQKIINQVVSDAEGKEWGDGEWTKQIKSRIAELGKQKGYLTYASQSEHVHGGEWLYDLTWLNYSDEQLLNVELVLESEWQSNGIIDDFQKLLLARSELRVMIFQALTDDEKEKIINQLKELIGNFSKSENGDRYLFSCWIQHSNSFLHENYVVGNKK